MFTCLYLLGSTHATAHRQSRVAATHALPFSPMCRGIFTLGHQAAGRCDDIRRARISDIIKPFKVSGVGPAQCDMVMLMINGGKANKSGKPEYMGLAACVRHGAARHQDQQPRGSIPAAHDPASRCRRHVASRHLRGPGRPAQGAPALPGGLEFSCGAWMQ